MELSIIFPAFNEEKRIAPTLRSFHQHLSNGKHSFELLVVDDGSSDNTVALMYDMMKELNGLRILVLPENKGKGHAIRKGMLEAKGTIRIFSDADGSTPVDELDKLLKPLLQDDFDISIGSRYLKDSVVEKEQPLFRRAWSRFANGVVQNMLLPGIVDPHCGFKAFSKKSAMELFSQCSIDGWSFDLEVLALAKRSGYKIAEVPVKWSNDEQSKGKLAHLPREIYNVYKIKRSLQRQKTA